MSSGAGLKEALIYKNCRATADVASEERGCSQSRLLIQDQAGSREPTSESVGLKLSSFRKKTVTAWKRLNADDAEVVVLLVEGR